MSTSRTAEKLIAALHFEMNQDTAPVEVLENVFKYVNHVLFTEEHPDEDATDDAINAALDRGGKQATTLAEYVLRGVLAIDRPDLAERAIEDLARRRRECAARFNMETPVPWAPGEREELAAKWDAQFARAEQAKRGAA